MAVGCAIGATGGWWGAGFEYLNGRKDISWGEILRRTLAGAGQGCADALTDPLTYMPLPGARYADEAYDAARAGRKLARGCSFAADTPVALADGTSTPIADVREGESVLAWDEATGATGAYRVVATWAHDDPATTYLTIDGDRILATPEHPFATRERGWVPAGLLKVGEHVRKASGGWGVVHAARSEWDAGTRYNLTVDGAHTYAVGDGGWVVHNANCAKSISSLEARIAEHQAKIAAYKRNPDAFDPKGFLENAPTPEIREQIIRGRIKHLETEVRGWQKQIEDLRKEMGDRR